MVRGLRVEVEQRLWGHEVAEQAKQADVVQKGTHRNLYAVQSLLIRASHNLYHCIFEVWQLKDEEAQQELQQSRAAGEHWQAELQREEINP